VNTTMKQGIKSLGLILMSRPSPYFNDYLRIYSAIEEASLSFGGSVLTSYPRRLSTVSVVLTFSLLRDWLPTTFTHHSERIINYLL
jgi:hypothetical protein